VLCCFCKVCFRAYRATYIGTGVLTKSGKTKPATTKPGTTKPGYSDMGLGLGNKVKNKVRVMVRN